MSTLKPQKVSYSNLATDLLVAKQESEKIELEFSDPSPIVFGMNLFDLFKIIL